MSRWSRRAAPRILALLTFGGLMAAEEPKPDALVVEAWISTAGPYGEGWDLKLVPSGAVALRVFYSLQPSGSLMGEFTLSEEQVTGIRRVIEAERFFDLPPQISAPMVTLHQPDLRLEVWLGSKHHKVALYDPSQLKGDARVRRFMAVWNKLYEGLPIRPSW